MKVEGMLDRKRKVKSMFDKNTREGDDVRLNWIGIHYICI